MVAAFLLVALALGIDNFAAAVGIGVSGARGFARARVALLFGVFEAGMPVLGMLAGHAVSSTIGSTAHWAGGGLLIAVGAYQILEWIRSRDDEGDEADEGAGPGEDPGGWSGWGTWRLLASGVALSIDNLVVGFALGAYHVTLVTAALVIGLVSVAMSLAGLELGARLGNASGWLGERGEAAGGVVLVAVGIAMAAGAF